MKKMKVYIKREAHDWLDLRVESPDTRLDPDDYDFSDSVLIDGKLFTEIRVEDGEVEFELVRVEDEKETLPMHCDQESGSCIYWREQEDVDCKICVHWPPNKFEAWKKKYSRG